MNNAILDLSALFWRMWHASSGESIGHASSKCLDIVRRLKSQHDDLYIALDKPPYKRKEVYPEYKAGREHEPMAVAELEKTIEILKKDGFIISYSHGHEADDVIATFIEMNCDKQITVYGCDKDLLQVCNIIDPVDGKEKSPIKLWDIENEKVVDFLTLCGDKADNLKGVEGIGPKTAVKMLKEYGSVSGIYKELYENKDAFSDKMRERLVEANAWIDQTRQLITLERNLDLDIEHEKYIPPSMEAEFEETEKKEEPEPEPEVKTLAIQKPAVEHEQLSYKQGLEPVGITEAKQVAKFLFDSKLYGKFENPQAILATIMRGRALGIDATTALDQMHVIKGRPTMAAALMVGLVMSSKACEYLYCENMDDKSATWVTKRKNNPKEQRRTFTIEEANKLQITGKDNWRKQPNVMLQWRAAANLMRQVYPDIILGLYALEEME